MDIHVIFSSMSEVVTLRPILVFENIIPWVVMYVTISGKSSSNHREVVSMCQCIKQDYVIKIANLSGRRFPAIGNNHVVRYVANSKLVPLLSVVVVVKFILSNS